MINPLYHQHINIMESEGWKCAKHKAEGISFVCVGNVWHFQALCNACLPEHTKNHPKNIKVQLESIKEVFPRAKELKQKVTSIFDQRMKKCNALKDIPSEEWAYIRSINERRVVTINQVNAFFDELIHQTKKRRQEEEQSQKESIRKVKSTIQEKIAFFKKEEYADIDNFCNEIKKYYFKDNLQIYVEEIDEIIQEYEEKTIKYDPFVWSKELGTKLKNVLKESCKVEEPGSRKEIKEKVQTKKQAKKKEPPGRKRCPNCKEEMEYLTEWKKHLVCRNCGSKQRNYLKKV